MSKLPSPLTVVVRARRSFHVFVSSVVVVSTLFLKIKNDLVIGKQYQQSKQNQVAEGELCTGSSAK